MKHSKKLILTILFIFTALVVLWVTSSRDIQDTINDILNEKPILAHYPISYLNNTQTQQFNQQGLLSYTLNAKLIRQFEVDDVVIADLIIDQPYLTIYGLNSGNTSASNTNSSDNNQTPEKSSTADSNVAISTVSADLAEGFNSNEKLTLKGNVIVIQTLANGEINQLQTSILYLEPSRRYAETDKPVIITDPRGVINAVGMKLFFDEQRIELLSSVVSRYSSLGPVL